MRSYDHAPPAARASFADLFLAVLDNGETRAGNGASIACHNLLIIVTTNVAEAMVTRQPMGFTSGANPASVRADVQEEIATAFSSAFLSRVGRPILFNPLNEAALAQILEDALRHALETSAQRLGIAIGLLAFAPYLGEQLLQHHRRLAPRFGAREFQELGRSLVTAALRQLPPGRAGLRIEQLHVGLGQCGTLLLDPL